MEEFEYLGIVVREVKTVFIDALGGEVYLLAEEGAGVEQKGLVNDVRFSLAAHIHVNGVAR